LHYCPTAKRIANLCWKKELIWHSSIGDSDFTCEQMGRTYKGKLVIRPTPNINFRRVDALMFTDSGQPILTISTVLPK